MSWAITPETTVGTSAIATAGTFTLAYPTGYSRSSFVGGSRNGNILRVGTRQGGKYYTDAADYTLSFGATTITVTWKNAATIAANTVVQMQLDIPGVNYIPAEWPVLNSAALIKDRVRLIGPDEVWINLGNPAVSNDAYFFANAAHTGTTAFTLLQTTLDVPRNLIATSSGDDSLVTITIVGTDEYGAAMSEVITCANAGVAAGKKAFWTVASITPSASFAANIKLGHGNVLGLPLYLPAAGHIIRELQDDATATAGTTVAGLAIGTKPTTTTADNRGTYVPNATPDSSKSFGLICFLGDVTNIGMAQV